MNWEYIKEKILNFGNDDYVFADMFIAIINEYDSISNSDDTIKYTFRMLRELMDEYLIEVFVIDKSQGILVPVLYDFHKKEEFLRYIDTEWKKNNYKLPEPNELFWITTNANQD